MTDTIDSFNKEETRRQRSGHFTSTITLDEDLGKLWVSRPFVHDILLLWDGRCHLRYIDGGDVDESWGDEESVN